MELDLQSPAAGASLPGTSQCAEPTQFISAILHQFAESLGNAIDAKDQHTSMHSAEVAQISHALALVMGLSCVESDVVHVAGHLHDIGKIGVPDAVLCKQGPLDPVEWVAIRNHPEAGADILRPVAALRQLGVVDMVLHHHERFDGNGYPQRIKGEAIPLGARIISLADSLSAMLQNRPYRQALSFEAAQREIIRCSGTQFDPVVVEAFAASTGAIRSIMEGLSEVQIRA
ncbi:HD-GYP domain-containing protein [Pseudodesulfovibrio piezophilus]|uniref:Metal dependent phosphohydrolase n=1 Tax=Pseudodesulfovibrio piezophilus (strain DSM 21447 / JCM 15486 / C1TLV30) TaxID=1322246 RepID=M1WW24_PSEP2|nr:HD domain-containing phosphohydrolase [Pseudodesulfovibrio piezophilus]CCH48873.1 Metal dependent phosphohydrolase [Pseudodesulfovibrio piezophilus C1TLV30]